MGQSLDHTIGTWLANTELADRAHFLERLPRYVPELGWRAILELSRHVEIGDHLDALAYCVRWLIVRHGSAFIDRIEAEAEANPRFKACLAEVFADPGARIPEQYWERLSRAAGSTIGPVAPHMEELYQEIPSLAEVLEWDSQPLDPATPPPLTGAEISELAEAWIGYRRTFWAWEEVERLVVEEDPETAWGVVRELTARAPESAMPAIGAGPFEDLLKQHGERLIADVEAAAGLDQRLRLCLSHVWKSTMADHVWLRVVAARGDEPQRG